MVPGVLRAIGYTTAGQGLPSSSGLESGAQPSPALDGAIKAILNTLGGHLLWLRMLG